MSAGYGEVRKVESTINTKKEEAEEEDAQHLTRRARNRTRRVVVKVDVDIIRVLSGQLNSIH